MNNYKIKNAIYDNKQNNLIKISNYPILIGDKIDFNYYNDIFKYYFIKNTILINTKSFYLDKNNTSEKIT